MIDVENYNVLTPGTCPGNVFSNCKKNDLAWFAEEHATRRARASLAPGSARDKWFKSSSNQGYTRRRMYTVQDVVSQTSIFHNRRDVRAFISTSLVNQVALGSDLFALCANTYIGQPIPKYWGMVHLGGTGWGASCAAWVAANSVGGKEDGGWLWWVLWCVA